MVEAMALSPVFSFDHSAKLLPAAIWLHGDALTVEYQETPLAQYTVRYQPDKKHFEAVPEAL